ncbi:dihydroxyacetone kinase [Corynebacterium glutamicum]|uniref:dihydroxyacetone kinase family protein n=1 Tax=Corynebacterium glutamicum TaxID=1718 RepID=UPI00097A4A13|nr:dihydroxyacetone kinase family protein [Corynebacterium glutamicum]GAV96792.1 dihydroxyacetone kinase [Corynebacterium glutamicum]
MTKIFNDPAEFAEDQLEGFLDLYSDRVRGVPGGVVALRTGEPQVAVVIGGGCGHYPAFSGLVGQGFATGAVVGNIFTSPSAAQVYSVAKAANQGKGVVLTFGNYAGDNMNFGIAADRLRKEGIDTRIVVVTDDVASSEIKEQRRGIAGDFSVFKVLGAAAAAGLELDQVEKAGKEANNATHTIGVALSGCTMPGVDTPLFTVPEDHAGLGLGIHGEPGIRDMPMPTAYELAELMVSTLLKDLPVGSSKRVAPILNGLGTSKYEELFILWGSISKLLKQAGFEVIDAEVGELVTSLDMGGVSLTLMCLDDELETYWSADAYTPAYRKQRDPLKNINRFAEESSNELLDAETIPESTEAARRLAVQVLRGLENMAQVLHENETKLGQIDAVAGDGDHGRGMVKGINAALKAAQTGYSNGGGAGWILQTAGRNWAERAGGTSGVLWGAALEAAGHSLTDNKVVYEDQDYVAAIHAFSSAILELGGASIGDKTLVDAMLPFVETISKSIANGTALPIAWSMSAEVATNKAAQTEALVPKRGRARPLAEKSVGTPDAGATSFALLATGLSKLSTPQNLTSTTKGATESYV